MEIPMPKTLIVTDTRGSEDVERIITSMKHRGNGMLPLDIIQSVDITEVPEHLESEWDEIVISVDSKRDSLAFAQSLRVKDGRHHNTPLVHIGPMMLKITDLSTTDVPERVAETILTIRAAKVERQKKLKG